MARTDARLASAGLAHRDIVDPGPDPAVLGAETVDMAQAVPNPPQTNDRKRVKVYELRNNDWFDRGTGFCSASFVFVGHLVIGAEILAVIAGCCREADSCAMR